VRGAFALDAAKPLKGKSVLLVDDVYTSGATVNECSRVLVRGGAKAVHVLTLARTL
jgi:predicted amidophosphoribosyltransferase